MTKMAAQTLGEKDRQINHLKNVSMNLSEEGKVLRATNAALYSNTKILVENSKILVEERRALEKANRLLLAKNKNIRKYRKEETKFFLQE